MCQGQILFPMEPGYTRLLPPKMGHFRGNFLGTFQGKKIQLNHRPAEPEAPVQRPPSVQVHGEGAASFLQPLRGALAGAKRDDDHGDPGGLELGSPVPQGRDVDASRLSSEVPEQDEVQSRETLRRLGGWQFNRFFLARKVAPKVVRDSI